MFVNSVKNSSRQPGVQNQDGGSTTEALTVVKSIYHGVTERLLPSQLSQSQLSGKEKHWK